MVHLSKQANCSHATRQIKGDLFKKFEKVNYTINELKITQISEVLNGRGIHSVGPSVYHFQQYFSVTPLRDPLLPFKDCHLMLCIRGTMY